LDATRDQWTHEPWSGLVDAEHGWIWGRGTADTKGTLVAILEAVEMLLKGGFAPKKTVILAFGFDEEISGLEVCNNDQNHSSLDF
jgi:Gly-Xaa carboxypeptidase